MFSKRGINAAEPRLARLGKWIAIATLTAVLSACSSGGNDDGGIIGTGIMLDGTTSSTRTYASNDIEIKARSGERSTAAIANTGRFSATEVKGDGPYLLRADLGNGDYLYGIGHDDGTGSVRRNIHSYTDAAVRNWFATNGLDVDGAFAGTQAITSLPTEAEIDGILNSLFAIVAAVLGDYNLSETNLATTSYDANDTGVDLYLDSNPVLVNNGNITIIVTDQDTLTLTQASTNVPLTTDLTAVDNQAPSAPSAVRALASASNEIVVVWESAIDNIGVTAYQVFRDGNLIVTTPYPVYTDTNLSSNTDYSYTVVAIDASGNASVTSTPAISQTLAAVDSMAPPAPQSVVLTPAISNMRISWAQIEINDVAAFKISRSIGTDAPTTLANVTATFLTDFSVMSGTEYCYQIAAVDASGNESAATSVACESTLGSTVTTGSTPIDNPDNTPSTGDLTAPMVDVSGLLCTEVLDRNISQNTTLSKGCYLANSGISVEEPANLTLQPGVVIKFGSGDDLVVSAGASLTANGTATDPIVLSGSESTPGFWNGIHFSYTNSTKNLLDHVQVEYAGGGSAEAGINTTANGSFPTRVSISNTSMLYSSEFGFNFDSGTLVDKFDRNRVTGNRIAGQIEPAAATSIINTGSYTGNTIDKLLLTTTGIESAATFDNIGIPFLAGNITVAAKLDIKPGVTIEFRSGAQITVNSAGTLSAIGTTTNPILLTATEPTPGYWNGVRLVFSNTGNTLEHVTIEYGGSAASDTGNLVLTANSSNPTRLSASNLVLRNSQTNGFSIDNGSNLAKFDNVTSTMNQRAGYVATAMARFIGTGSNFMGNTEDLIRVGNGSVDADSTWRNHGVPYSIAGLSISTKLDIDPGVSMIMDAGAGIRIDSNGALSANGTAALPIVFTGKESTPGYWDGIHFIYSPTINNKLAHVVVEYGGGGSSNPADTGNITMTCNGSNPSRVQISDTALNFSLGWGLFIDNTGCTATIGTNVSYSGNGQGAVNLAP